MVTDLIGLSEGREGQEHPQDVGQEWRVEATIPKGLSIQVPDMLFLGLSGSMVL